MFVILWYCFPRQWRKNSKFRERFKFFVVTLSFSSLQPTLYGIWTNVFLVFPEEYQWILALLLPLYKEVVIWIIIQLGSRCAYGDQQMMEIACTQQVEANHALFLAYTIGASIATNTTEIIMLITDFLVNLYLCIKIAWINKENPNNQKEQIEMIINLVIAELTEFTTPIIYLLSFSTAYFGPVATLYGGVKSDYFHHTPIEDFGKGVENVAVFFLLDALSVPVCFIILYTVCRINLYPAFVVVQKEFGVLFAINLAICTYVVSKMFR